MDRKDFYFRELVTEGDMNAAWDNAENADRDTLIDATLVQKVDNTNAPLSTPAGSDFNALLGGIVSGLNVTITGTNATVTAGTAYDAAGERIHVPSSMTVSLATTGTTSIGAGGTPGGVGSISTTPASAQFIWILLQIFFNRLLSDPREDGNDATVYFNEAESFQFSVKCSVSSATPTMPGGDPGCIILGAFKINSSNVITTEDYSTRGDWLRTYAVYTAGSLPTAQAENGTTNDPNFIANSIRQAILKLRNTIGLSSTNYTNHISQSAPQDRHAAKNIDFDATTAGWADGTTPALGAINGGGIDADGVQGAINQMITDLADQTTGFGGTKFIGGASISGSPVTIVAGTLRSQISAILTGLNNHLNAVSGAHAASAISATAGTTLTGTDVQNQLTAIDTYLTNRTTGSATTSWGQNDWIYTTALGKPTQGFDHFGFLSGRALNFQETWITGAGGKATASSGAWFGPWNYGIFGTLPVTISPGGASNSSAAPRGPGMAISAASSGTAGAGVVESASSYFVPATGIIGMDFDFAINGGSGSIKSQSTFAIGFGNGNVINSASTDGITTGTATFDGTYITVSPGATQFGLVTKNSALSVNASTNTGVNISTGTVYRGRIIIGPASVSDNATNTILLWLNTGSSTAVTITLTSVSNMSGLFLTPFIRATGSQGETYSLVVGPMRIMGHLADSSVFI